MSEQRPPFPPFTHDTALKKLRGAADAWSTCNPAHVALGYSIDSYWRNRAGAPNPNQSGCLPP
jgi:nuclear transport factor 2 (NTF2) superfamily protein